MINEDALDDQTIRMTEMIVLSRLSTKHVNLWMHRLEMKRTEINELAELFGVEEVKKAIENERSPEKWAKRCTNHFTKKDQENVVRRNRQRGLE